MTSDETKRRRMEHLVEAAQARKEADNAYKHAIDLCAEAGITNVKMAKLLGVSETAIRLMRKRMQFQDY